MTGGTEREIRGRTTRTKGSPGQVVDRAGDSGLCRVWFGAVVKLRPRVFQHDETTCVLRFQQEEFRCRRNSGVGRNPGVGGIPGRVDLGGCPPRSPTDPGLHITRTRFLIS